MSEIWVIQCKEDGGDWKFYTSCSNEKKANDYLAGVFSWHAVFRKIRYIPDPAISDDTLVVHGDD